MNENDGGSMQMGDAAKQILIASKDLMIIERFSGALRNSYRVAVVYSSDAMTEIVVKDTPDLILIDPKILGRDISSLLSELTKLNSVVRIILIENQTDRQVDQYELFKAGAHGFCKDNISESLLNRAVQMVCEGEFWIQRKLIAKVINELAKEIPPQGSTGHPDNTNLEALTPRELEVAKMVRLGGNNKMIARELDISERTVKAHLSAIFRKLDIQNRLHLALYFDKSN